MRPELRLYLISGEAAMIVQQYEECAAGVPLLWRFMMERYLGQRPGHFFMTGAADDSDLWALCHDSRVPRYLRVCLSWTGRSHAVDVAAALPLARYCAMAHVDMLAHRPALTLEGVEPLWERIACDLRRYSDELTIRDGDSFALGCDLTPWGRQWLDPCNRRVCFNSFGWADLRNGGANDPQVVHEGLRDLDLRL